jgi:hypothetical protein
VIAIRGPLVHDDGDDEDLDDDGDHDDEDAVTLERDEHKPSAPK